MSESLDGCDSQELIFWSSHMQIWTLVDMEVQTETWLTRLVTDVHGNALATLSVGMSLYECGWCDGEHPSNMNRPV